LRPRSGVAKTWAGLPVLILFVLVALVGIAIVRERYEEIPRVPYELAEYAGVGVEDLGTARLFTNATELEVSIPARRPGRVRFLVAGDGGQDEDPGKRALERRMRELCLRGGCDFVLLTGDNVYPDGIDAFGASALADSIPGFDLQAEFLSGASDAFDRALAARVRAAAGRVASACGAAAGPNRLGARDEGLDSSAAEAYRRHFEPKFERTFGWAEEAGIPVFVVLGNHDWRSPFGAECEIGYSLAPGSSWTLPFYFYQVEVTDPAAGGPLATLFVLYSAPPHASPAGENYTRIGLRQQAWLRSALSSSRGRWKLSASHHPVWSAGGHTLTEYFSFHADLLAVLAETGARLDLLLAGHNHWLESVRVSLLGAPALQVVSGSLSKVGFARMLARGYPFFNLIALDPAWRTGMVEELGTDPRAFLAADRSVLTRGFALVELGDREATVRFFGVGGELFSETFRRADGEAPGQTEGPPP
jgi:hypothetical protein